MESTPYSAEKPEDDSDDSTSKKKSKKQTRFMSTSSPSSKSEAGEKNQDRKPSALDKVLAELAVKKQAEEAAKPEVASSVTDGVPENQDVETAVEADLAEQASETITSRDLEPNELSTGEGFIDLDGPIEENVIPLRTLRPEEANVTERAEVPKEVDSWLADATEHNRTPELVEQTVTAESVAVIPEAGVEPHAENNHLMPDAHEPLQRIQPEAAPIQAAATPIETIQPRPEDIYQQDTFESTLRHSPAIPAAQGERLATKQDIEDALYLAEKTGQNNGVLAGFIVGGGYEHFKHRRREKRREKLEKQQNKKAKHLQEQQLWALQEQRIHQATVPAYEQRFGRGPVTPEQKSRVKPELGLQKSPEHAMQPAVQADASPEQVSIPAEHRLEASAWLTTEVDRKTGKPVENPTVAYGREYYNELRKESGPGQDPAGANGSAGSSGAQSGSNSPLDYIKQSKKIPLATKQAAAKSQAVLKSVSQSLLKSDDGPVWPWATGLAVIILLLILVLR